MKQHFRTAWKHTRRSPYQSLAAVLIMFLTFFIATIFTLAAGGSQIVLRYFESRPQVTAFFKDEISTQQIDMLKAKLVQTEKVEETKFISKEEALAIYREQNKDEPLLLEMVTANILPASLEVSIKNITDIDQVAGIMKNDSIVEEVVFQEDVVEALYRWTGSIRKIGIGLISVLSLVSFLIILVIIGMKITIRKSEIEILQLIGASNAYIRAPFVLEGIIYGVSGAVVAWGLSYILLLYATPFIIKFLVGIPVLPVPYYFMLIVLGIEMLAGLIIGSLGSLIAVRRYLK